MEDRYIACILLHAVGDSIGYKNGEWEFSRNLDKVYEFIDLGGINHMLLKGWSVSDDTILHMEVAKALIENKNNTNLLCKSLANRFVDALNTFEKEGFNKRNPGKITVENFKRLRNGSSWNKTPYKKIYGGSGAAMRSLCIGLVYHRLEDRDRLLEVAIETSRISHNSAVGFLGGFTSALFTALAVEDISVNRWPFVLMNMINQNVIDDYIKKTDRDYKNYSDDSHEFIKKWQRYILNKFDKDGNVIRTRASLNLYLRSDYYDNFGFKEGEYFPGSGGDDSVIIAYDALIDAGDSWEKLVFYSMLHKGDTDTTGCIAAGWYGAVRGFQDVPEKTLKYVEFKKELQDIGKRLYKFY